MGSRSIVGVTLALASIVLILAGLGAYRANITLAAASANLRQTKDTELALANTLSVLRDAEIGQRGYLLTRRTEYLAPYELALTRIQTQLAELSSLVAGDPVTQRSFNELQALVQVKTDELARTVELERSGATADALALVLTDAGRLAMDEIRTLTERMLDDEERKLEAQATTERGARATASRAILALTVLAVAILVVLVLLVRRDSVRLRESEQRLATTLRSIGDGVIATDEKGLVSMCNPVAEALTGWKSADARGRHMDEVFRCVNEMSRATVESPVAKVLREGRIVGLANHTLLIRRDGAETPIEDSAAPITDEHGRILGVVLVFRDATEVRAAQQALQDADSRKNEFLAVLAHELRNPLAPIRQAAQVARSSSATPAQIGWSTEVIERQVGHMARLLDDLLDVSRITRGTLEVRKSRVELGSVIEAAIEMAQPLIDSRRHTLTLDVSKEPLPLDADPLRIAQVIANILTNAAKYTSSGGRIRLSAERSGDYAVVHVIDNGVGLSRESLATIFQMFVQIAPSPLDRDEGGLGIGLALSKGLVELHAGTIEASSPGPGHGSELVVRLPLARERRENPTKPAALASAATSRRKQLRIVVADDNRDAAASLAALLELEGHQVDVVNDGAAALEAIRQSHPDIALLDIGMPSLNGYDIARRVRAADWGADITLVAVTGWGQETDKDMALEAGFDQHWVKPVAPTVALELCNATAARRAG